VALICGLAVACALGTSDPEDVFASASGAATNLAAATSEGTLGTGDLIVLMVVDRSGSMSEYWNAVPKWSVAQSALSRAIDGVEQELTIGALLFPQETGCDVLPLSHPSQIQFQRGDTFRNQWESSNVASPEGGTPLGLAFQQAEQAILSAQRSGLEKPRFRIVVVTDGEPSCGENPEDLVAQADLWRKRGIEVEVLGLPGSQAAEHLLHRIAGRDPRKLPTGDQESAPATTWDPEAEGAGYVAPQDGQDVDDSIVELVR